MEWISYPEHKPKQSQPYLISVSTPISNGEYIFNYIGYYNAETDKWHKYDPFSDENIKEQITDRIIGWSSGLTSYLG